MSIQPIVRSIQEGKNHELVSARKREQQGDVNSKQLQLCSLVILCFSVLG
jgi:hypothetical protein